MFFSQGSCHINCHNSKHSSPGFLVSVWLGPFIFLSNRSSSKLICSSLGCFGWKMFSKAEDSFFIQNFLFTKNRLKMFDVDDMPFTGWPDLEIVRIFQPLKNSNSIILGSVVWRLKKSHLFFENLMIPHFKKSPEKHYVLNLLRYFSTIFMFTALKSLTE